MSSLRKTNKKSPYLAQRSDSDEECEWTDVDVGIDFEANKSTLLQWSNIFESSGDESIQLITKQKKIEKKL
jgi:hypothetical protein